jgi:nicotinamide-nucleotide amidase
LDALRARGQTVATAESLTAGLVCATIASVPGASDCLLGGLAAYATRVKSDVLGVDPALIERHGAVSAECAQAMARCAGQLFGADWGVATTGVAGPAEQDGHPVGTVFVAVVGAAGQAAVRALELAGGRREVREGAVDAALSTLVDLVGSTAAGETSHDRQRAVDQG